MAMFERDLFGMVLGLFAGALWDMTASGASFNALFLLTVGFLCGTLINTIMRNNVITAFILSTVSALIYNIGYWLIHHFFSGFDKAAFILLRYYLLSTVYTVIFVPLIFIVIRAVEKKFAEE